MTYVCILKEYIYNVSFFIFYRRNFSSNRRTVCNVSIYIQIYIYNP